MKSKSVTLLQYLILLIISSNIYAFPIRNYGKSDGHLVYEFFRVTSNTDKRKLTGYKHTTISMKSNSLHPTSSSKLSTKKRDLFWVQMNRINSVANIKGSTKSSSRSFTRANKFLNGYNITPYKNTRTTNIASKKHIFLYSVESNALSKESSNELKDNSHEIDHSKSNLSYESESGINNDFISNSKSNETDASAISALLPYADVDRHKATRHQLKKSLVNENESNQIFFYNKSSTPFYTYYNNKYRNISIENMYISKPDRILSQIISQKIPIIHGDVKDLTIPIENSLMENSTIISSQRITVDYANLTRNVLKTNNLDTTKKNTIDNSVLYVNMLKLESTKDSSLFHHTKGSNSNYFDKITRISELATRERGYKRNTLNKSTKDISKGKITQLKLGNITTFTPTDTTSANTTSKTEFQNNKAQKLIGASLKQRTLKYLTDIFAKPTEKFTNIFNRLFQTNVKSTSNIENTISEKLMIYPTYTLPLGRKRPINNMILWFDRKSTKHPTVSLYLKETHTSPDFMFYTASTQNENFTPSQTKRKNYFSSHLTFHQTIPVEVSTKSTIFSMDIKEHYSTKTISTLGPLFTDVPSNKTSTERTTTILLEFNNTYYESTVERTTINSFPSIITNTHNVFSITPFSEEEMSTTFPTITEQWNETEYDSDMISERSTELNNTFSAVKMQSSILSNTSDKNIITDNLFTFTPSSGGNIYTEIPTTTIHELSDTYNTNNVLLNLSSHNTHTLVTTVSIPTEFKNTLADSTIQSLATPISSDTITTSADLTTLTPSTEVETYTTIPTITEQLGGIDYDSDMTSERTKLNNTFSDVINKGSILRVSSHTNTIKDNLLTLTPSSYGKMSTEISTTIVHELSDSYNSNNISFLNLSSHHINASGTIREISTEFKNTLADTTIQSLATPISLDTITSAVDLTTLTPSTEVEISTAFPTVTEQWNETDYDSDMIPQRSTELNNTFSAVKIQSSILSVSSDKNIITDNLFTFTPFSDGNIYTEIPTTTIHELSDTYNSNNVLLLNSSSHNTHTLVTTMAIPTEFKNMLADSTNQSLATPISSDTITPSADLTTLSPSAKVKISTTVPTIAEQLSEIDYDSDMTSERFAKLNNTFSDVIIQSSILNVSSHTNTMTDDLLTLIPSSGGENVTEIPTTVRELSDSYNSKNIFLNSSSHNTHTSVTIMTIPTEFKNILANTTIQSLATPISLDTITNLEDLTTLNSSAKVKISTTFPTITEQLGEIEYDSDMASERFTKLNKTFSDVKMQSSILSVSLHTNTITDNLLTLTPSSGVDISTAFHTTLPTTRIHQLSNSYSAHDTSSLKKSSVSLVTSDTTIAILNEFNNTFSDASIQSSIMSFSPNTINMTHDLLTFTYDNDLTMSTTIPPTTIHQLSDSYNSFDTSSLKNNSVSIFTSDTTIEILNEFNNTFSDDSIQSSITSFSSETITCSEDLTTFTPSIEVEISTAFNTTLPTTTIHELLNYSFSSHDNSSLNTSSFNTFTSDITIALPTDYKNMFSDVSIQSTTPNLTSITITDDLFTLTAFSKIETSTIPSTMMSTMTIHQFNDSLHDTSSQYKSSETSFPSATTLYDFIDKYSDTIIPSSTARSANTITGNLITLTPFDLDIVTTIPTILSTNTIQQLYDSSSSLCLSTVSTLTSDSSTTIVPQFNKSCTETTIQNTNFSPLFTEIQSTENLSSYFHTTESYTISDNVFMSTVANESNSGSNMSAELSSNLTSSFTYSTSDMTTIFFPEFITSYSDTTVQSSTTISRTNTDGQITPSSDLDISSTIISISSTNAYTTVHLFDDSSPISFDTSSINECSETSSTQDITLTNLSDFIDKYSDTTTQNSITSSFSSAITNMEDLDTSTFPFELEISNTNPTTFFTNKIYQSSNSSFISQALISLNNSSATTYTASITTTIQPELIIMFSEGLIQTEKFIPLTTEMVTTGNVTIDTIQTDSSSSSYMSQTTAFHDISNHISTVSPIPTTFDFNSTYRDIYVQTTNTSSFSIQNISTEHLSLTSNFKTTTTKSFFVSLSTLLSTTTNQTIPNETILSVSSSLNLSKFISTIINNETSITLENNTIYSDPAVPGIDVSTPTVAPKSTEYVTNHVSLTTIPVESSLEIPSTFSTFTAHQMSSSYSRIPTYIETGNSLLITENANIITPEIISMYSNNTIKSSSVTPSFSIYYLSSLTDIFENTSIENSIVSTSTFFAKNREKSTLLNLASQARSILEADTSSTSENTIINIPEVNTFYSDRIVPATHASAAITETSSREYSDDLTSSPNAEPSIVYTSILTERSAQLSFSSVVTESSYQAINILSSTEMSTLSSEIAVSLIPNNSAEIRDSSASSSKKPSTLTTDNILNKISTVTESETKSTEPVFYIIIESNEHTTRKKPSYTISVDRNKIAQEDYYDYQEDVNYKFTPRTKKKKTKGKKNDHIFEADIIFVNVESASRDVKTKTTKKQQQSETKKQSEKDVKKTCCCICKPCCKPCCCCPCCKPYSNYSFRKPCCKRICCKPCLCPPRISWSGR